MMGQKRPRVSVRDDSKDDDIDRLSDLPDCVLLHIMGFLEIEHAVQTCVLSKRWKNLWKCLTNMKLRSSYYSSNSFSRLVSQILLCYDSIPLHALDFYSHFGIQTTRVSEVLQFAVSHNLQQLTMEVQLNQIHDFELPTSIFSCHSLTFLKLVFRVCSWVNIICPKSLEFPALKSLHLERVTFSTRDDGCVEPFSTCNKLNDLVIDRCNLQNDEKVLYISNSKLSNLTIKSISGKEAYKVELSTPKLSSLSTYGCPINQLSSTCNLSFLKEVNINASYFVKLPRNDDITLLSLLKVVSNVMIMTLSSRTIQMLNDLLSRGLIRTRPPCFVRLKSLILEVISDDGVNRILEFLLQNSPSTRVDVIKC